MPKQELLEVPELHNPENYQPASRKVDPAKKGDLTCAMNDMIRDELGHDEIGEGKQKTSSKMLGKSRLLEYLGEKGELLDGRGNPISADVTRSDEDTAKYFDTKLKNGESFFIYGKHDLYPREISYDKESGELRCSEALDHRPERPEAGADRREIEEYQRRAFAFEHFSNGPTVEKRVEKDEKLQTQKRKIEEIKRKNEEIKAQNAALDAQQQPSGGQKAGIESKKYDPAQPLTKEIPLDNEPGILEVSKAQRLTEQFALAVAKQMGYGDEFRKMGGGTLPLSQLATDGVIIAADGGNIEMSDAAKEDAVAKAFGEKLLNGADFYVRRKGEEFPRKISFDKENNCLTIGEQLKEPPEEVPAPGRWQRFANTFRKNKAVAAYNQYQKDKSAYEIVSGQAYQSKVKQTDPIFKARAAEQARKERQLREQKRAQETQKTKEQEAKEYGTDFAERVQKRAEDMMADYEYNHPDRPLTETGRNNIIKLCSNYEKAKSDLTSGNLKGKNGAVTVRDLLAYELASKGINDPKSNQMMSNVNNRYFSSNMGNLVKETADFRYMIRTGHDAEFFRKELDEPQNLERNMQSVYKKATVMARKADAAYLQEKQNRQTLRMREGITEDMIAAAKNGDVQALKKAAKAEENHVQTHIKPAKELAKNFEALKNQTQPEKNKAPVMN